MSSERTRRLLIALEKIYKDRTSIILRNIFSKFCIIYTASFSVRLVTGEESTGFRILLDLGFFSSIGIEKFLLRICIANDFLLSTFSYNSGDTKDFNNPSLVLNTKNY